MIDISDIQDTDPEEFVEENRETIITVLRNSSDPLARAFAWALLDRYSEPPSEEELLRESEALRRRRASP